MTRNLIWKCSNDVIPEVHEITVPHVGNMPLIKGEFSLLPKIVQSFVSHWAEICLPKALYICDGSIAEADMITHKLEERGLLHRLKKLENCWLCKTDPKDVARMEAKTFISTVEKHATVPHTVDGVKCILGQWLDPQDLHKELDERFPGCMSGRIMYIIPFSMGPVGSPMAKYGVQITDSNYVVLCMRLMTRIDSDIWRLIDHGKEFVKCLHSLGCPRPVQYKVINHWPCNPDRAIIAHLPDERTVLSFGSGYGGNSLLGKKCFALRIASRIGYDEGWLAEHMLIMSVTNPFGQEKFIAAAFPSACGKTNMAMLLPTLPGWKVKVIGDDIAWMRFNKDGRLHAINPEAGLFGVAPGTNYKTNPNAMQCFQKNSIFTNVAETDDSSYFWEGLEKEMDPNMGITSWMGTHMTIGQKDKPHPAAHPNSRFCCPIKQCPIIHEKWEDPEGVPISAIVFGGRRPEGVPLVFESFSWQHGVLIGASIKSESTAAAEHVGKQIMHDPMAMRPFMGYNFGKYLQHWLNMEQPGRQMPKIFHVNWFRLDDNGKFVWPGFGENIRIIDWMCRRVDGEDIAEPSPIGWLPKPGSIDLHGLNCDWNKMFNLPKDYWLSDIEETRKFLLEQAGCDLPDVIIKEINDQASRIRNI